MLNRNLWTESCDGRPNLPRLLWPSGLSAVKEPDACTRGFKSLLKEKLLYCQELQVETKWLWVECYFGARNGRMCWRCQKNTKTTPPPEIQDEHRRSHTHTLAASLTSNMSPVSDRYSNYMQLDPNRAERWQFTCLKVPHYTHYQVFILQSPVEQPCTNEV